MTWLKAQWAKVEAYTVANPKTALIVTAVVFAVVGHVL